MRVASLCFLINGFYFFRAVLGLQKNGAESPESSLVLPFASSASTIIKILRWCDTFVIIDGPMLKHYC